MSRAARYLVPNLVTALSLVFGLASLLASFEGRIVDAAWLVVWSVLLDRLDGGVARLLRATSAFGAEADSFADLVSFGVAPAALFFSALHGPDSLGLSSGVGHVYLVCGALAWVLANAFRLARFNVLAQGSEPLPVYFGVPTTMAAGTLIVWFLALLKYTPETAGAFGDVRLLGSFQAPSALLRAFPMFMIAGAVLMVSNIPFPKLGRLRSQSLTYIVLTLAFVGYVCGTARILPEFMALLPTTWLLTTLVWGRMSPRARALKPPKLF